MNLRPIRKIFLSGRQPGFTFTVSSDENVDIHVY
jgi:hypothetical protein